MMRAQVSAMQMNANGMQMAANRRDIGFVSKMIGGGKARVGPLRLCASHLRPFAFRAVLLALSLAASTVASAAVTAKDAWVRGTVPAQQSTGAFVTLQSSEDAKVVGVKSPAAKSAEIHASTSANGMMHMHAVGELPLPAGKRVELQPGGYHVMLVGLAKPLAEGDEVPLVFTIVDARGKRSTLEVKASVRPLGR
jgi:copper(I)-binding protein